LSLGADVGIASLGADVGIAEGITVGANVGIAVLVGAEVGSVVGNRAAAEFRVPAVMVRNAARADSKLAELVGLRVCELSKATFNVFSHK
jgi:hypothetical protein